MGFTGWEACNLQTAGRGTFVRCPMRASFYLVWLWNLPLGHHLCAGPSLSPILSASMENNSSFLFDAGISGINRTGGRRSSHNIDLRDVYFKSQTDTKTRTACGGTVVTFLFFFFTVTSGCKCTWRSTRILFYFLGSAHNSLTDNINLMGLLTYLRDWFLPSCQHNETNLNYRDLAKS